MSAERWHFPKQSPASLGIDSAGVERFLDALENEHIDIHSFLMIRHGKLAVEGYRTSRTLYFLHPRHLRPWV